MREHDVTALIATELEAARRELAASLALAQPGSPVRVPIQTHMAAIDTEVDTRDTRPTRTTPSSSGPRPPGRQGTGLYPAHP